MAFYGDEFIFDDITCTELGLMIYHFGAEGQGDVDFQNGTIIEDRIPGRYDALTYGLVQNQALEYTLVFGANMESIDAGVSIDRFEIEAITSWLTGHSQRKWLTIVQDDMDTFRYKCIISQLRLITYGDYPWAFSCRVSCDSPFAYTTPQEYDYDINGSKTIQFFNRSSYNGYYYPKMVLSLKSGDSFDIVNKSDKNRKFSFKGLPGGGKIVITIDNQNQIITNDMDLNIYPNFNMNFLRLRRGDNVLEITGNAHLKLICEFPVNIGG